MAGAAVLVRTGWDAHFGTEQYGAPEHPFLATDAAAWLADHGAVLVGIDSVNIDATRREATARSTRCCSTARSRSSSTSPASTSCPRRARPSAPCR